jgi:hypothetical protein
VSSRENTLERMLWRQQRGVGSKAVSCTTPWKTCTPNEARSALDLFINVYRLAKRLSDNPAKTDFSIDVQHEASYKRFFFRFHSFIFHYNINFFLFLSDCIILEYQVAMFVHDQGKGVQLTDVPEFCTSPPGDNDDCVTSFLDSSASCVSGPARSSWWGDGVCLPSFDHVSGSHL